MAGRILCLLTRNGGQPSVAANTLNLLPASGNTAGRVPTVALYLAAFAANCKRLISGWKPHLSIPAIKGSCRALKTQWRRYESSGIIFSAYNEEALSHVTEAASLAVRGLQSPVVLSFVLTSAIVLPTFLTVVYNLRSSRILKTSTSELTDIFTQCA